MTDGTADDESKTADDGEAPATEDSSSSDRDGPGGGPRRVVSDQSVDDILASLNDTTARAAASEGGSGLPTDDADSSRSKGTVDSGTEEIDAPTAVGDDGAETTSSDGTGSGTTAEETDATGSSNETEASDAAESSDTLDSHGAPDESSSAHGDDDLAARIETGDVTGADVRAAEAGEGRERTPDIDEVELSLDDLEGTTTDDPNDAPAADGPLAESLEERGRDSSARNDDLGTATKPNDEGAGLLERLKGLFSR